MSEWIRDIVNQSSSMAERLSDDYRAQTLDEADAAEVQKRLTNISEFEMQLNDTN